MVAARSNKDLPKPAAGKPSLRARLHAWWEGYDLPSAGRPPASPPPRQAEPPAVEKPKRLKPGEVRHWTQERLEAAQRLFGAGCHLPGGEALIEEFIKPLGLDETQSVVDLGAGIGSLGRIVARETGAWVDAVEPDSVLADEAEALAKAAGLSKKAAVARNPLTRCRIKPHSRDAVVSREAFYLVADKPALLAETRRLLKPGGQLLFTDLMRKESDDADPDLQAWGTTEPSTPHLVGMAEVRQSLLDLGFDVRIAEDISASYCETVMEALQAFAVSLQTEPPGPEEREWLLWETDYWARRVALLRSGGLALYRFYARLPELDPGKG